MRLDESNPNLMNQTMCETQSGVSPVESAPDCIKPSKSEDASQVAGPYSVSYCAKRYRVPVSDGRWFATVDEADYPLVSGIK